MNATESDSGHDPGEDEDSTLPENNETAPERGS